MTHIRDLDTSRRLTARVLETERITPESHREEVRHLLLEVDAPGLDFDGFETVGVLIVGPEDVGTPELMRLYAIAGTTVGADDALPRIELCVRRCFYIDEFSGEEYPGIVSSWLCDLDVGDELLLTGPFGNAFQVPDDPASNLVMIGHGTGIAPFRTLVRRIYDSGTDWLGKVRLFHGARTGLEMLYRNDVNQDLGLYMSNETFQAIEALSPRPHFGEPVAFDRALTDNAGEVLEMIRDDKTHVYVAGLRQIASQLDDAFSDILGSKAAWAARKDEMRAAGRWQELLY